MRLKRKGKTVKLEVAIWWDAEDQTIHLASNDSDTLILTIKDDPSSMRGHPKLFRELAKLLRSNGAPAPELVQGNAAHLESPVAGARDLDFHPVEIRGEPLSATVIREKR